MGIYAATDCGYHRPWYGKMAGGYFKGYPRQQQAMPNVADATHASPQALLQMVIHGRLVIVPDTYSATSPFFETANAVLSFLKQKD